MLYTARKYACCTHARARTHEQHTNTHTHTQASELVVRSFLNPHQEASELLQNLFLAEGNINYLCSLCSWAVQVLKAEGIGCSDKPYPGLPEEK